MVIRLFIVLLAVLIIDAAGTPLILQPGPEGKDTYVKIDDSTPHGDADVLEVRKGIGARGVITSRTFIEFDLSAYSGITVNKAELRLWSVYRGGRLATVALCRVSNVWNESTLIWEDNIPFGGPEEYLSQTGGYYYFDVTSMVSDWITLGVPNYGTVVKFEDESGPNDGIVVHSSDNTDYPGKRPALLIWSPDLAVEPGSLGAVKALFR